MEIDLRANQAIRQDDDFSKELAMAVTAIDLFAGGGGFSQGAREAGVEVVWAANHNKVAVQTHMLNHPGVEHACQDLHQADWTTVPKHDLLLASPACTGHSPSRGKERPGHDAARSTAWAVISCMEAHRPKVAIIENVPALMDWRLFPAWEESMRLLGYSLSAEVLDAKFFGVPQQRERLFIVARRGKNPFRFHKTRAFDEVVPVREAIELDTGDWSPVEAKARQNMGKRPLVERTMACIDVGIKRYGRKGTFWLPYFSSNRTAFDLDRPIWTQTCNDRFALYHRGEFRFLTVREVAAVMGFPKDYVLTGRRKDDLRLLGNAVAPPVATYLISWVLDQVA